MQIHTGKKARARRTMLYGPHGVGKSSWAAGAPRPIFLNVEDGLDNIDCASTSVLATFQDVLAALRWLYAEPHDYQTIVIDSADWVERLIHQEVADAADKDTIADIGYGAGYKQALGRWDSLISAMEFCRRDRNLGIVLLAHADIKRFQSPESDTYDRYQPALHDLSSALLMEWCDEVLFASYRVFQRKEDLGFDKTRTIAVDGDERYIRTQESAAVIAKNRLDLDPEIAFPKAGGWYEYAQHFPQIADEKGTETQTPETVEA